MASVAEMAEAPKDEPKPTLHHLNNSQSQRVLWLLEELRIPYNLVLHERLPTLLAPPSLKAHSKQGKAPILITASGATITESVAVIRYLFKTYDVARKFQLPAVDEDAAAPNWVQEEMAMSIGMTTIATAMMIDLLFTIVETRSPFGIRHLLKLFTGQIKTVFVKPELHNAFSVLEDMLVDKEWFSGQNEPGLADFVLSWPADILSQRQVVDFSSNFPRIAKWMETYQAREAYKSALEKGNGYSLAMK